jgi:hypothetical protein
MEFGIPYISYQDKLYDILYVLGDDIQINIPSSNITIYSGHHIPTHLYYDLYIPTNCFFEIYNNNNISYWLNCTYNINRYSDRIINAPGDAVDNITLFNILTELYDSNIYLKSEILNNLNIYLDCLDINNILYVPNNLNVYYQSSNVIYWWDNKIFYLSDKYSENNYIMYSSYTNIVSNYLQ